MSHYEVLGLSPALVREQADPRPVIRRAYRRALLRNHPDKAPHASLPAGGTDLARRKPTSPATLTAAASPSGAPRPSVDQISEALRVLSSPALRATYDQSLRLAHHHHPGHGDDDDPTPFRTGVETVDLDVNPHSPYRPKRRLDSG